MLHGDLAVYCAEATPVIVGEGRLAAAIATLVEAILSIAVASHCYPPPKQDLSLTLPFDRCALASDSVKSPSRCPSLYRYMFMGVCVTSQNARGKSRFGVKQAAYFSFLRRPSRDRLLPLRRHFHDRPGG
jgi:hypothetical protein